MIVNSPSVPENSAPNSCSKLSWTSRQNRSQRALVGWLKGWSLKGFCLHDFEPCGSTTRMFNISPNNFFRILADLIPLVTRKMPGWLTMSYSRVSELSPCFRVYCSTNETTTKNKKRETICKISHNVNPRLWTKLCLICP